MPLQRTFSFGHQLVTSGDDIERLDLATKIRLLSGADFWHTEQLDELDLPALRLSDGPHGLRVQQASTDHLSLGDSIPSTCFPTAVTLGSTWDIDLLEEVGRALGAEARALGVDVLLGPGLNLKRHPAAGRNFEYFSEDPLVSGKLAAAMVRGIQECGVAACPKHFVANNQEKSRMRIDTIVDNRTLRELYLRGFEIVVDEARPWAMMAAYNRVNGEHAGESRELLTEILRDEWEFDGVVVSDWLGVYDRPVGVWAGLDLEMPASNGCWDRAVEGAVSSGQLPRGAVDQAVGRIETLARRVATDEEPPPLRSMHGSHHELARRAAVAGTVLLMNDGILPLSGDESLAVVGAFAAKPRYQGGGSSRVIPTRLDALLPRLLERFAQSPDRICHVPGYDPVSGDATADQLADAVAAARECDVAVVVAGLPTLIESEGWDRGDIELPASMNALIAAVAAENPRTVVILQNGAPVAMPWLQSGAKRPAALIEAWLGGQAGGSALVDVLYGDREPTGRLAESLPEDVSQLPADADFSNHPTRVVYREGLHVGYRFHDTFDVPPTFCFGHGLGYTSWEWGALELSGDSVDRAVSVELTNTGDRRGSQVVQLYVSATESAVHRPAQELKAFDKVTLDPGQTQAVVLQLDRRSFTIWDIASQRWVVEPGEYELRVGASSRDIRATATIEVKSADRVTPAKPPRASTMSDEELATLLGHALPGAAPLLPYHRDSLFDDLNETLAGRALLAVLRHGLSHRLPDTHDEESRLLVETVTREAPFRNLAATLGGKRALRHVDRLIALLNRLTFR